jgi:multiple sugar transport system substrate-binding protein
MKKYKFIGVLLAILVFTLASCGPAATETPPDSQVQVATKENTAPVVPATTEASENVTLRIMHNWEPGTDKTGTRVVLAEVIAKFSELYPNITIDQEIFGDLEIPTKVETAFLVGEEPDIVFANQFNTTVLWPESGVTFPVQDYLSEWGMGDNYFLQSALDSYTSDKGDLRAFPLEGFYWPILYREDLFKAAGVEIPKTQEELIQIAPALRAAGFQPLVVGGTDWTGLNLIMLQMQGCMDDKEGLDLAKNGGWANNANAKKCADLFVQMRDGGVLADNTEGLDFSTMNAEFFTGKYAMMMTGSWSFPDVPQEFKENIVALGFPPAADSPQEKPVFYSSYNAKGVWITRNGVKNIDAVEKFVRLLYSPEFIARFIEEGLVSPLSSVKVDETKIDPLFVKCWTLADTSHVLMQPQDAFPATTFGSVERTLSEAYVPNGLSAQQILEALDSTY